MIIEKITKQQFSFTLRDRILNPLGLINTYFPNQEKLPGNLARGYDTMFTPTGWLGFKKDTLSYQNSFRSWTFADGNIASTASDVSKFLYNLFEGKLITSDSKVLLTDFVKGKFKHAPEQIGYGLGLRKLIVDNVELWGHTGLFMGYCGISLYSPEHGYVISIMSNVSKIEMVPVVSEIQKYIIENI